MCGIAGSTEDSDGALAARMCATMGHRGPDDEGLHTDPGAGVSLGIRRLAVIDVRGGHQPLCNEDRSVWVVCNGEIYNHRRLREELRARGHRFATGSDAEVLVHLYEEYGEALVHALEGMFAFALWDAPRRRLLIARDRFGEKPLFWHEQDGELLFASELSALLAVRPSLRELDAGAIDAFFVFAYVPGPGTIVRRVRQLRPGHLLSWSREDPRPRELAWWTPPASESPRQDSPRAAVEEARELFARSVRTRLIADVPVGVFLSGGVDSALVAAVAARESSKRLRTFTVGYDTGSVDETRRAREVAARLGSEHHEVTLTQADVAARAPALLAALDQPLADRALVPLHALCEFARPRVTVALGGEGSDELFGGYPRYRWLARARALQSRLPGELARGLALLEHARGMGSAGQRLSRLAPGPLAERNLDWTTARRRHSREELYGPRLRAVSPTRLLEDLALAAGPLDGTPTARWLMHLDQVHYLPDDVLVKSDRASMLVSLELRTPFLHAGLADLAGSLESSLHLERGGKTLVHAMLAAEQMAPARSLGGYRKTAFRVPAAEWLRGPL
ncbi:MAG TPA: asparagine synthase (glutamine-hydrolyzing), partial [Solirubrobacteraceae bacterium]|nr:asparagine synthase (glutamine-hydrolyzing) [Solirubrobacteraceae bacterium]